MRDGREGEGAHAQVAPEAGQGIRIALGPAITPGRGWLGFGRLGNSP